MTVKELKEILNIYPEETTVVFAQDDYADFCNTAQSELIPIGVDGDEFIIFEKGEKEMIVVDGENGKNRRKVFQTATYLLITISESDE